MGIDQLCEGFRSRGAEIVEAPTDRPRGRQFAIKDLNGCELAFLASS